MSKKKAVGSVIDGRKITRDAHVKQSEVSYLRSFLSPNWGAGEKEKGTFFTLDCDGFDISFEKTHNNAILVKVVDK